MQMKGMKLLGGGLGCGGLRCFVVLSLAAALCAAAAAMQIDDDGCRVHAAVTMPMVMRSLSPWIAARRLISSDETAAAFKATGLKRMPVIVYNSSVYFTRLPQSNEMDHPWSSSVGELVRIAAANPQLGLEFILNLDDWPQSMSAATGIPVWGFNRQEDYVDIALPHYYVHPDVLCFDKLHRKPFMQRRDTVIGRFSHFCPAPNAVVSVHGDGLRLCPRTYFTELTERVSNISDIVELDVATTNQLLNTTPAGSPYRASDNKLVTARSSVPFAQLGDSKYICVTDGFVSAGKLAGALALGSVVLLPASKYEQYFEPALVPWVHYVPLWVDSRDDLLGAVAWLHAHPEAAQRIAEAGRRFSCRHLSLSGRTCWWKRMAKEYNNALLGYKLDDAWFAARRAAFGSAMVEITPDVLKCDAQSANAGIVNRPPPCVWKGPVDSRS